MQAAASDGNHREVQYERIIYRYRLAKVITTPTIPYVYLSSVGAVLLPLLAPLDDLDLPHQLVGQRRQIEEDAVIIDGCMLPYALQSA